MPKEKKLGVGMDPILLRDLGLNGVMRSAEVDDYLQPAQAVAEAVNLHFDRKGSSTLRPGLTLLGSAVSSGYPCLGIYDAHFNTASNDRLLSAFSDGTNNDIYAYNGTSWSKTLADDTKDLKTRFTTFCNHVIRVNGTDNMKSWAGGASAWTTSGDPTNVDDMADYDCSLIENFNLRVWTAGYSSNPDRVYFSSIISTTGNITWTPATDYDDINPNDGENLTALKKFATQLICFKPNRIYRHKGIEGIDPEPFFKIGTYSQESVVEAKNGLFFHHPSGIYIYAGGYPQEISRPISDFISAVPRSYYDNVAGWKDADHVYFTLGDLTVGSTSFTNVVIRYTISSKVWTIYSYAPELAMGCDYDNGTTASQVVADTTGSVYTLNSGLTDNGTMLQYRLITQWYELGAIAHRKIIRKMIALCESAQASILMYQIDDEAEWHEIGQLRKYLNYFPVDIRCHRIRFKLAGTSDKTVFVFRGIEIIDAVSEGVLE